jgi:hypothetical protein
MADSQSFMPFLYGTRFTDEPMVHSHNCVLGNHEVECLLDERCPDLNPRTTVGLPIHCSDCIKEICQS